MPTTATRPACTRNRRRALSPLCALLATIGLCHPASADTWTWTGGASGNWSDPANWAEGLPASAVDTEIVFNAAARSSTFNDIAGGLVLNRLTLGAAAAAPVLSGQALNFQGSNPLLSMLGTNGNAQVQTALVLGSTLAVQGGSTFTSQLLLRGAISGSNASAGLQLNSGLAVLSGNNTYTGLTSVAAGAVLGVGANGLASTQGINVATGGELQIAGGSSTVVTTLVRPIQLGGVLSSSAKRIDSLFGPVGSAFVQSAVTLTSDATVLARGASGTGLNSTAFAVNGAIDRAGHTLTLRTNGANNELSVGGSISGAGGLVIEPAGGSIGVNSVSGGDVRAQGTAGSVSLGTVSGDGALRVAFDNDGGSVGIFGVLSGARPVEVARGTLTLGNAANSFTGTVLLRTDGTLKIGNEAMLGNAANTLRFEGGGLLRLTDATGGLTRAVVSTGGMGAVNVGSASTRTFSSSISGDGGISFFGNGGVVSLSGSNSFAGGLRISDVRVTFTNDANLGQAGAPVLLGGTGRLVLPAGYDLQRPLSVGDSTAQVSGVDVHTLGGPVTGAGRLNLAGAARFTLTGNNSHSGGVALAGNAGVPAVLVLDSDARLGAAGGVLNIGDKGTCSFCGLPGTLVASGDLNIAATRRTTFASMTVDTNGHTVVFNQPISGLNMTKQGAGVWLLNTANTDDSNTNPVRVDQGTLQLGVANALGSRAAVTVASGAVLDLNGRSQGLNGLTVNAGGSVQLGGSTATTLSLRGGSVNGGIAGLGNLAVVDGGSLSLNAANSFTGSVRVSNGAMLQLGHAQALGAAGNVLTLDNGVLAAGIIAVPVVLSAAQPLVIGAGGAGFQATGPSSLVIERQISGSAPLRFIGGTGPGDLMKTEVRLTNSGNDFVRDIQLGDAAGFGRAVLGISADGALGAAGNRVLLGNTFFTNGSNRSSSGGLRAFASFTLPASRTVLLNGHSSGAGNRSSGFIDTQGHTLVLQGGIGETSAGLRLLKTGAGTLVLNGNNTYTGTTQVDEGTLSGSGEVQSLLIVQPATLAPGESAGLLRVRGNLSFSGGLLQMELGGLQRGSGYDALDIGGSLALGFNTVLSLRFIGGFLAQGGQQFQLVDGDTDVVGSFANVADGARLLTDDGAGSFVVHYGTGQGLRLTDFQATAAVPEPATWGLMALGLLGVGAAARRRRTLAG